MSAESPNRYPFQRQQRLLKATEFAYVFDRSYKSTDRYLTVLAKPSALPTARLGLAIARKRVRSAVDRNRIKRLARDSFRLHQYQLKGLDCVVLAKSGIEQVNNYTLLCSLTKHWQQLVQQCRSV